MNNTFTAPKIYTAEIKLWSAIGDTPLTGRGGSFCDELVSVELNVLNPTDARTVVQNLIRSTPRAVKGYFNIPSWPNQNTRSAWL